MIETETEKKLTVEEFMKLPYVNVELIDGNLVQEPSPGYGHQGLITDIIAEISVQLKKNKLGKIRPAPLDIILGTQVLQPDLLFISNARLEIVKDDKVYGAPDVAFEIISPGSTFRDTKVKFDIYQQFGVKEYFIVYPDDKTVVRYVLSDGKYHEEYREIGIVKSELMGCEVNF